MRTGIRFVVSVVVGMTLLSTLAAHAKVRYVAGDGAGQDGLSWASAYKSIEAALDDPAIVAGDEIRVKKGTYTVNFPITVDKAVKILGGFSGNGDTRDWTAYLTTVSGNESTTCMIVHANARIEGLTFTNGDASIDETGGRGGALYINNCGPTVTNCVFSQNKASSRGGAIATQNASGTTITDCLFSENRASEFGGAIANLTSDLAISGCTFNANKSNDDLQYMGGGGVFNQDCAPTISDCTFTANSAYYGAGICNFMADALIEDCSFADCNSTTIGGGGIMNYGCSAMINRCLFKNNTTDSGGAILEQSTSTIVNCIMWNNTCYRYGGAICLEPSDGSVTVMPNITNCTIYGNRASNGGGLYSNNVKAIVRNCIIWGNTAYVSGSGIYQFSAAIITMDVRACDVQGDSTFPGSGNIRVEPAFVDAGNGNFTLTWGSPCIDVGVGTAAGLGSVDYAGKPRVVDGNEDGVAVVDMGALEFRGRYIDDYLFHVEISQNIVYDSPSDTSPDQVFLLVAETGDTVIQVQFHTPGGKNYSITSAPHATPSAYVDTYHRVEGGKDVWEYRGTFPSFPLLSDYGDGVYYLTLLYKDGTSHQTTFWYGVPGTSTTLSRPTQQPHITSPSYGGPIGSPAILTWDACTDASANTIYVGILDPNSNETLVSESLGVTATHNTGFSLEEGLYNAQIAFENHYELTTEDDIPFVYGKAVIVPYQFEVPYSAVYRFWSPKNDTHFYTIKESEKQKLIDKFSSVWTFEGRAYNACATQSHEHLVPVYRFWSAKGGTHFYTIKESEKDKLVQTMSNVWTFEGVAFYAYAAGTQPPECKPVYRFWNAKGGTHFYTMKESEKEKLLNQYSSVYAYEGVAFYTYE